jgi:hypothetical protein
MQHSEGGRSGLCGCTVVTVLLTISFLFHIIDVQYDGLHDKKRFT